MCFKALHLQYLRRCVFVFVCTQWGSNMGSRVLLLSSLEKKHSLNVCFLVLRSFPSSQVNGPFQAICQILCGFSFAHVRIYCFSLSKKRFAFWQNKFNEDSNMASEKHLKLLLKSNEITISRLINDDFKLQPYILHVIYMSCHMSWFKIQRFIVPTYTQLRSNVWKT